MNGSALGFEAELFKTADKLRGNMEPSDYKHVAEDKDEYLADNIFWVPKASRWSHLKASAGVVLANGSMSSNQSGEYEDIPGFCKSATLYDVNVRTINEHLKRIFTDGKTNNTLHYKLPAIIAVGYKVNSEWVVQFCKWASDWLGNLQPILFSLLTLWDHEPDCRYRNT